MSAASDCEAEVTLRDGTCVTLRPIRPEDAGPLREGFERLSRESRYRRFLSGGAQLSGSLLRYLTEVDHHNHEALIAALPDGSGLGVARFVRSLTDPQAAEVAVTVSDEWQRRGVGTALLGLLADRARAEGVHRFTALMLATNTEMLDLLERLGPVRVLDRAPGTVEVELELPDRGPGAHLLELLRASASGRYESRPGTLLAGPPGASPEGASADPPSARHP